MDEKGRYWSSVKSWVSWDCLEHIPEFPRTIKWNDIYLDGGKKTVDLLLFTLLNTEIDLAFEKSILFTDLIIEEKGISGLLSLTDLLIFLWWVYIYVSWFLFIQPDNRWKWKAWGWGSGSFIVLCNPRNITDLFHCTVILFWAVILYCTVL